MIDHKRVHSDKMEYNCHTCGQQFKWKLQLERHMMDHTGVGSRLLIISQLLPILENQEENTKM